MRFLKFLALTLVVALGFSSCKPDGGDGHDHTSDLAGTWTCLTENYAEALIINADGTAVSYGVENGEYWENVRGTVVTDGDNNITMTFEDNDNLTGHFDIIPGQAFSLFEDSGERYSYQYCENDLADEIIGMWLCTDAPTGDAEATIVHTYMENGKAIYTGYGTYADEYLVNKETTYEVVGDLLFYALPKDNLEEGAPTYIIKKLTYVPNGLPYGDIMEEKTIMSEVELTSTMLRIKQSLDFTGKVYDYKSAFVTNAKGKDEDFTIMGNTFNIAKIKAYDFDKMFGADLFNVELNANSFKYSLLLENGQETGFDTPMTVDGNKVTLDMSAINPALRKVEMYMFQDANDTQVHIYMHTDAFINYFANMEVYTLILEGQLDPSDAAVIEKVFADMEARVESINVSFVMKARK